LGHGCLYAVYQVFQTREKLIERNKERERKKEKREREREGE